MKMLKGFENWEMVNHLTAQDGTERISYKVGHYNVIVTDASYMPGNLEITVRAIDENRYTPEIYISSRLRDEFQTIHIQTTSWGSLELSEIDKVVAAYADAQAIAHEIQRAFPQCFKN